MALNISSLVWNIKNPKNPFEKAKYIYDTRAGSILARAKNYRLLALVCLVSCIFQGFIVLKYLAAPKIIPYIVEVAETGRVLNYGKMMRYENYKLDNSIIHYYIIEFLKNILEIDNNIIAVKRKWNRAYRYISGEVSSALEKYYYETDPLNRARISSSEIIIKTYLDRSDSTKEIEVSENVFDLEGNLKEIRKYKFVVGIEIEPKDLDKEENPLGIYINKLIISEIK